MLKIMDENKLLYKGVGFNGERIIIEAKKVHNILRGLVKRYGDEYKLVYKGVNLPMSFSDDLSNESVSLNGLSENAKDLAINGGYTFTISELGNGSVDDGTSITVGPSFLNVESLKSLIDKRKKEWKKLQK
jgi:hypothetical protein